MLGGIANQPPPSTFAHIAGSFCRASPAVFTLSLTSFSGFRGKKYYWVMITCHCNNREFSFLLLKSLGQQNADPFKLLLRVDGAASVEVQVELQQISSGREFVHTNAYAQSFWIEWCAAQCSRGEPVEDPHLIAHEHADRRQSLKSIDTLEVVFGNIAQFFTTGPAWAVKHDQIGSTAANQRFDVTYPLLVRPDVAALVIRLQLKETTH